MPSLTNVLLSQRELLVVIALLRPLHNFFLLVAHYLVLTCALTVSLGAVT